MEDRFIINELGSPNYMQLSSLDLAESSTSSSSPKSTVSNYSVSALEIESYLQFYFVQIQPFYPLFVPSYFHRQYATHELPRLLVYAVCLLASHFQYQNSEDENYYYQKVMTMLDEAIGKPSVALVQTLLLLIKYLECKNQFFFFEKTKSLMARTIEVCKTLQLYFGSHQESPEAAETRKRTFCMVFVYNTLLCVEQGIQSDLMSHMNIRDPASLLPSSLSPDDTMDSQRFIISFSFTLSQIHQHILSVQPERRNEAQQVQESIGLLHLQVMIENDLIHLPSQFAHGRLPDAWPFPAPEEDTHHVPPMTRFVHMLYHLNIIVLHYHYMVHPFKQGLANQPETRHYPHRQMCLSSASALVRLIEGLLSDPSQSFRYLPRGVQALAHCVTSALTLLRAETSLNRDNLSMNKTCFDEYQRCSQLAQRLASLSPSLEMRSMTNTNDGSSRRNTISSLSHARHTHVPSSLLQSSSADVGQFNVQPLNHQPLTNLHQAPLHFQDNSSFRRLRGSTQSCQDLRSMNRIHMNHPSSTTSPHFSPGMAHRGSSNKSVASAGSTSSNATAPYRHYPPYPTNNDMVLQPSSSSGKIRRIKKSMSSHGLSSNFNRQQQQQQQFQLQQQFQFQQLYQQQEQQMLYTQQLLAGESQSFLHRPYQPSYDDDIKVTTSLDMIDTTPLPDAPSVAVNPLLMDGFSSMNLDFNLLYHSPTDNHFGQKSEGHPLL
ncbi:hypothetical protein EDC96DRAFT_449755 [Choanephora cucurbitarum]|nr:hypothetical protein EDC96DRAFT_449755 [Choanephora cucurbitarum]